MNVNRFAIATNREKDQYKSIISWECEPGRVHSRPFSPQTLNSPCLYNTYLYYPIGFKQTPGGIGYYGNS